MCMFVTGLTPTFLLFFYTAGPTLAAEHSRQGPCSHAPTYPCRRCHLPVFVDKLLCPSCNHRRAVIRLEVTTHLQPWINAIGKLIRAEIKPDPRSQVQVQLFPFPWEFFKVLHSFLKELPDGALVTPLLQSKGRLGGPVAIKP